MYGGHASIHVRYDSRSTALLYRQGENAPGDNVAFLQGKRRHRRFERATFTCFLNTIVGP